MPNIACSSRRLFRKKSKCSIGTIVPDISHNIPTNGSLSGTLKTQKVNPKLRNIAKTYRKKNCPLKIPTNKQKNIYDDYITYGCGSKSRALGTTGVHSFCLLPIVFFWGTLFWPTAISAALLGVFPVFSHERISPVGTSRTSHPSAIARSLSGERKRESFKKPGGRWGGGRFGCFVFSCFSGYYFCYSLEAFCLFYILLTNVDDVFLVTLVFYSGHRSFARFLLFGGCSCGFGLKPKAWRNRLGKVPFMWPYGPKLPKWILRTRPTDSLQSLAMWLWSSSETNTIGQNLQSSPQWQWSSE